MSRQGSYYLVTPRLGNRPPYVHERGLSGRLARDGERLFITGVGEFRFGRELSQGEQAYVVFDRLPCSPGGMVALEAATWLQLASADAPRPVGAHDASQAVAETVAELFLPFLVAAHNELEAHAEGTAPLSRERARQLAEEASEILHQFVSDVTGGGPVPDFQQPPSGAADE